MSIFKPDALILNIEAVKQTNKKNHGNQGVSQIRYVTQGYALFVAGDNRC